MSDSRPANAGASGGPFSVLGLPASAAVTDDDVRSAWRRIAAATHPDRPGGGDPAGFTAASAAYTTLRTRSGRSEALADLADLAGPGGPAGGRPAVAPPPAAAATRDFAPSISAGDPAYAGVYTQRYPPMGARTPVGLLNRALARVVHGRPAVLAARLLIVAAVGTVAAALVGSAPATPALITGALTWLLLTARHDLAPRE